MATALLRVLIFYVSLWQHSSPAPNKCGTAFKFFMFSGHAASKAARRSNKVRTGYQKCTRRRLAKFIVWICFFLTFPNRRVQQLEKWASEQSTQLNYICVFIFIFLCFGFVPLVVEIYVSVHILKGWGSTLLRAPIALVWQYVQTHLALTLLNALSVRAMAQKSAFIASVYCTLW